MDGAGTLSGRWALGAGRAPTRGCAICHGPRLPGARLCAPCKAALKRARLESVADLVPLPSPAAAEAEAARRRRAKARSPAKHAAPRRRPRLLVPVLAIAVAAIAAGGYLALRVARPSVDSAAVSTPRVQHSVPVPALPVARTDVPVVVPPPEVKSLVEVPAAASARREPGTRDTKARRRDAEGKHGAGRPLPGANGTGGRRTGAPGGDGAAGKGSACPRSLAGDGRPGCALRARELPRRRDLRAAGAAQVLRRVLGRRRAMSERRAQRSRAVTSALAPRQLGETRRDRVEIRGRAVNVVVSRAVDDHDIDRHAHP